MASAGIGERLRSARTARGLSLDDISAATRIRRQHLDALEREAWDELPGATYVRGFLGTYARQLGLSADEILGLYPAAGTAPASAAIPRPVEVRITPAQPQSRLRRIITAIAVVFVAGAVVLAYVLVGQLRQFAATRPRPIAATPAAPSGAPSTGSPTAAAPAVTPTASVPAVTPTAGAVTPTSGALAPPPSTITPTAGSQPGSSGTVPVAGRAIVVTAQATDRSWVRVVSDGSVVFEGFVSAGDHEVWQGRHQVTVRVGNASALDLSVNGQSVGRLGNPGDVADRTFSVSAPSSAPASPAAPAAPSAPPASPAPAAPPATSAPPASAPPARTPVGPPPPPNQKP